MDNITWFKTAECGMMIHFGVYSMLAGEYRGRRVRNYAEWAQSYFAIPNAEYKALAATFNPVYFNADEWIKLAKDCGMTYIFVTSKHHDGFALWDTKVCDYSIVKTAAFGRDVIGELANACCKYGLKLGLYYSQELDWNHPHGGGYTNLSPCSGVSWDNSWDFPDRSKKDFDICFEEKIKPQVTELMTNYDDVALLWCDTPHTISKEQSLELNRLVKHYQPDCLINSRIGNGAYDFVSLGDNEIPDSAPENSAVSENMNALGGYKHSPHGLYESAMTLNSSWGFKYFDQNWITPQRLAEIRKKMKSFGITLSVNVGPDGLGRIPSFSQNILRESTELL